MQSVEVVYAQEELDLGNRVIKYEWANQGTVSGKHKLIFHFFLGLKKKDPDFTLALMDAVSTIPNITYEISYTDDFNIDGHELVIILQYPFAKFAIRNCIVGFLKKALSKKC
jgi:hypothetical protein